MTSSRSSSDGEDRGKEKFDFAEAAETLLQLQEQLKKIESANGTVEEARELASQLEQVSNAVAKAGQHLQDTTEKLASACETLARRPTVSADELGELADEVKDLNRRFDANQSTVESTDLAPDGAGDSGRRLPWGLRWETAGMFALMFVLIAFQVLLWRTRPAPFGQEELQSHATQEKVSALAQAEVQVLNGVGKSGLASDVKSFLVEEGIPVVNVGNAPVGTFAETTIFVHQNAFEVADQVAARLGVASDQVHPGPPSESGFALTIIVGADYRSLRAYTREKGE